jgi:hypothetical protein
MNHSIKLLTVIVTMTISCVSLAQSARSLFDSGKGVTFNTEAPAIVDLENTGNKAQRITPEKNVGDSEKIAKASPPLVSITANQVTSKSVKRTAEKNEFSGLSYTIFKEISFDNYEKSDPSTIFVSGDRIVVEVKSNKAGTLIAGNINPEGNATLLSVEGVRAGYTTRIPQNGALKFVGAPGTERLVFVLSRDVFQTSQSANFESYITDCQSSSNTRSLVVDDLAGNQFQLIDKDGKCSVEKGGSEARTRSIVVDLDDNSGYGVIPDKEFRAGQLLSLIINLNHR